MAIDPLTGIDDGADEVAVPPVNAAGAPYSDVLAQLADQRKQILDDKSDLADSSGDLSARAILGLAPIVLGAAFYGMKGAAVGAQAGLAGNVAYQTLDDADSKERLALRKERVAAITSDIKDAKSAQTQAQLFAQQEKLADKRNQALAQSMAGRGKGAPDTSPEFAQMKKEAVERAQKMGLPADVADDLLIARDAEELNKIQDNIRSDSQTAVAKLERDKDLVAQTIGKSQLRIGDKVINLKIRDDAQLRRIASDRKQQEQIYEAVETGEEGINALIQMKAALPEDYAKLQQIARGKGNAAEARKIAQKYNAFRLEILGLIKQNPVWQGVLSNQDMNSITAIVPPELTTDANPVEWATQFIKNGLEASRGGIEASLEILEPKLERALRRKGIDYERSEPAASADVEDDGTPRWMIEEEKEKLKKLRGK